MPPVKTFAHAFRSQGTAESPESDGSGDAKALLARVLESPSKAPAAVPSASLGWVVDDRHPSLLDRVQVRCSAPEEADAPRWLPVLRGLCCRVGDRVVVTRIEGLDEPVVSGVIDGFTPRPEAPRRSAAALELKPDEALRVVSPSGAELVEVFASEQGPVVRVLSADVNLELEGRLHLRAKSLQLEATGGEARLEAADDVVLRGEAIRLN